MKAYQKVRYRYILTGMILGIAICQIIILILNETSK